MAPLVPGLFTQQADPGVWGNCCMDSTCTCSSWLLLKLWGWSGPRGWTWKGGGGGGGGGGHWAKHVLHNTMLGFLMYYFKYSHRNTTHMCTPAHAFR